MLDTFHDHRRAYAFFSNALGVQSDALWTEARTSILFRHCLQYGGKDHAEGFVIKMAIPFAACVLPPTIRKPGGYC